MSISFITLGKINRKDMDMSIYRKVPCKRTDVTKLLYLDDFGFPLKAYVKKEDTILCGTRVKGIYDFKNNRYTTKKYGTFKVFCGIR